MKKFLFWVGCAVCVTAGASLWQSYQLTNLPHDTDTLLVGRVEPGDNNNYQWTIAKLKTFIASNAPAGAAAVSQSTNIVTSTNGQGVIAVALSDPATLSKLSANTVVATNLYGNLANSTNLQSTIVTVSADATSPNSRRLAAGANVTLTDGGAGGTLSIASSGSTSVSPSTNIVTSTNGQGVVAVALADPTTVSQFSANNGVVTNLYADLSNSTNLTPSILTVTQDLLDPRARLITAGANITLLDGGPGSTLTIAASGGGVSNPNAITNNETRQFKLVGTNGASMVIDGNVGIAQYGTNATLLQLQDQSSNVWFTATSTNKVVTVAGQVYISGTTNFLKFGATNTAPGSVSAPTKWVSVQINGEGTAYRVPLYQ